MRGAAVGQKHVQMEMDRDEIYFFNLIDLIKNYGYTLVDYLYYRRKDSLVVIEQDHEVMDMLHYPRLGQYCRFKTPHHCRILNRQWHTDSDGVDITVGS